MPDEAERPQLTPKDEIKTTVEASAVANADQINQRAAGTKSQVSAIVAGTVKTAIDLKRFGAVFGNVLREMLIKLNTPLQEQFNEQQTKAEKLLQSHEEIKPRIEARKRVLAYEIDLAISEGRDDDVAAKRLELAELEKRLTDILSQADACARGARELRQQQEKNARIVFDECFPAITGCTVSLCIALRELLDETWASLQRYGDENGLTSNLGHSLISYGRHGSQLTPDGKEFQLLQSWFGGGRR